MLLLSAPPPPPPPPPPEVGPQAKLYVQGVKMELYGAILCFYN